ncbi:MAG TPA: hypothetical protein VNF49_09975 [Candidatus Binataceae bacterium]|nr:hypothetical protein [Candidatus Binataceae bacterium]
MDSTDFFIQVAEARAMLERAPDYIALRGRGHELVGGATLTCASDVPWQIQAKCSRCAGVFWFDNLAWQTGGADRWRLSADSRAHATAGCAAAGLTAGRFHELTPRKNLRLPVGN